MYALNFEYDGLLLSDYGFMICEIDGSSGVNTVKTGFDISFNTVKRNGGRNYGLASASFDECVQSTFHICKDPDKWDDLEITNDEYRNLVRWLNRSKFLKFRILNEFEHDKMPCYFNASFNIGKIYIRDILYGLELTMTTNAPFGYGELVEKDLDVPNGDKVIIYDMSDDAGFICPDMVVKCQEDGILLVKNSLSGTAFTIKNCKAGETITVNGETQIVTSSLSSHAIYDDFNYDFLRIGNTFHNRENVITVSMACHLKISYYPIIKDIP